MNTRRILAISTLASIGVAFSAGLVLAQQKSLKEQLVGTWNLVSDDSIANDGSKKAIFGAHPVGVMMLDANGHYAEVFDDPGRPKWKSAVRTQTTPEEYTTAAKGLLAQEGVWSVDEGTKTLTRKVEAGLSPNIVGTEVKATVAVSADELTVTNPNSGLTGGKTELVFSRVK
jgi:hypothetical protein